MWKLHTLLCLVVSVRICLAAAPCSPPKLANGYVEGKGGKDQYVGRFVCNHGFTLVGSEVIKCRKGLWSDKDFPVCASIGKCESSQRPDVPNGQQLVMKKFRRSVFKVKCNNGFKRVSSRPSIVYCDGKNWNTDNLPICTDASPVPTITGLPDAATVKPGSSHPLTCSVTADIPTDLTWFWGSQVMESKFDSDGDLLMARYIFTPPPQGGEAEYELRCEVNNAALEAPVNRTIRIAVDRPSPRALKALNQSIEIFSEAPLEDYTYEHILDQLEDQADDDDDDDVVEVEEAERSGHNLLNDEDIMKRKQIVPLVSSRDVVPIDNALYEIDAEAQTGNSAMASVVKGGGRMYFCQIFVISRIFRLLV